MTIFGTPGGTPLNTTPFQGTQPGNPVQATLQITNPGVGLFPPNSNNFSGDTVQAAISRGAIPANQLITGTGLDARGGRTVAEAISKGGEMGSFQNAYSLETFNSDSNGGSGPGAGQANQTEGPSSGSTNQLATTTPSASVTTTAGPQFGG